MNIPGQSHRIHHANGTARQRLQKTCMDGHLNAAAIKIPMPTICTYEIDRNFPVTNRLRNPYEIPKKY